MTEFRPGRFQILPPVVKNLIIINTLLALLQFVLIRGGIDLSDYLGLHYWRSPLYKPWQLLTHMFMHGSFFHLLFNMLALWMFGSTMERVWGAKRFLSFYLICGIVAALTQMASYAYDFREIDNVILSPADQIQYQLILRKAATVGASGAIMGVLAAFGYTFPNTTLFIMPIPFPIKAKWAILGIIALDIFGGISNVPGDNIAHFAHLGGAITGFIIVLFWNKRDRRHFF